VFIMHGQRTITGKQMFGMEVVNTRTGRVLASDNCCVLADLVDLAHEATGAFRGGWFWSIRPKDVR
jgi:hypothetical protein